jgi:hypothetical protein
MQVAYIDRSGGTQQWSPSAEELVAMVKSGDPVAEMNRKFADADMSVGTAFDQFKASVGLVRPGKNNPFGFRATKIGALLDGSAAGSFSANTQQNSGTFGTASRAFVNIAVISEITSEMQKDRETDSGVFEQMIANNISVDTEHFEQPVVDYKTVGGPEEAKATRVAQGAEPSKMLFFKTSDRIRRIGAWNIGMQWTDQALRNTNIDYVTRTVAHYLQVERDERVYRYINALYNGDGDLNVGAVAAVTSTSLDAAATGGVLTHKAFVKFLARQRKYRKVTHLVCDLDTYLKIEGRTGRPGSNSYDPTLTRVDPQAGLINVGFGNDVRIFLVDSAADGGPVPANTIYALDASVAISRVTNTAAAYSAVEEYAMKRSTAMRLDWAEEVFRSLGDSDLRPFDVLTIS